MLNSVMLSIALAAQPGPAWEPPWLPPSSMTRPSVWEAASGGVGGPPYDPVNYRATGDPRFFYDPSHPMHPNNG